MSISQEAYFRQRLIKYGEKHGVTAACERYRISRKTYYKWRKRYDGSAKSLRDRSKRPKNSPKSQTDAEVKMVLDSWRRDKGGDRLVMWWNCRKRGYQRCYQTFVRTIRKLDSGAIATRQKRKPKPYEQAEFPGQKMQADVKYVPSYCLPDGVKMYQYTMIDEFSRLVFRQIYDEHSTYSSWQFLQEAVRFFEKNGVKIRLIQTDNGTEWTKALISHKPTPTMWERLAAEMGINLTRIRIATPRHNGKVERQHRKDEQRFYRKLRTKTLAEARKKLAAYNARSVHYPIIALGMKNPLEMLENYKRMSTYGQLAIAC